MLLLKQVAICSSSYFTAKHRKLISKGFTHVVTLADIVQKSQLLQFENLVIRIKKSDAQLNLIEFGPSLMDFLRSVKLLKGKVVFVEPDSKSLSRLEKNQIELIETKSRQNLKLYSKSNSPELQQQIMKMKLKNAMMF